MTMIKTCACGCGNTTSIRTRNNKNKGYVIGEHALFIAGHNNRLNGELHTVDPITGCWNWNFGCSASGYGQINVEGKQIGAHVYMYTKHKGPIPDGLELDHLCRNTYCVNPDHLEAVTHLENMRRRVINKVGRSRVCANAHKYKGIRKPKCNNGIPCKKCLDKYNLTHRVDENETP